MWGYKYSCIVDTPYSLFLYLLMCKDKDWERTIFFVGDGIAKEYLNRLPKVVHFSTNHEDYLGGRDLFRIKLRALFWRLLYVNRTTLLAQDHLEFSSQLIGRNTYTLLEDAPGTYTTCLASPIKNVKPIPKELRLRLIRLILLGPMYGQHVGRNSYCKNRWVSDKNDVQSPMLKGKKYTLLDLHTLWDEASEEKKRYILGVFGVKEDTLRVLRDYKTIIFTEVFAEENMNLEEAASVFAPYIEEYKSGGVVIKPHPRDYMDWKSVFPDVYVIREKVPMQILSILGVEFEHAITVFSTAISDLNPKTEIIWLGPSVHPKLVAVFGKDVKCPFVGKFKNIRYS